MALSTINASTGLTDATVTSAKLADFSAAVDLNGVELILDADQDTSITADTDDQIDFKVGGSDLLRITATALVPATDDAYDLGTSSLQFRDIFTGDLNLNNTKSRVNEVDGTSGHWTIQEGAEDLFLLNNSEFLFVIVERILLISSLFSYELSFKIDLKLSKLLLLISPITLLIEVTDSIILSSETLL